MVSVLNTCVADCPTGMLPVAGAADMEGETASVDNTSMQGRAVRAHRWMISTRPFNAWSLSPRQTGERVPLPHPNV